MRLYQGESDGGLWLLHSEPVVVLEFTSKYLWRCWRIVATTFRACGGVGIYLQVPMEVLADCGYYIQSLWKCCALFAGTCGTFFYLRVPLTVQELTSSACECAAGT